MWYALLVAVLVVIDQLVKWQTVVRIPLYGTAPFIPYLVELTHFQNTGAAFSFLSDHTGLLAVVSAVVSGVILLALLKQFVRHPVGVTCLCVVLAGAVGNLIDRVRLGYVVDMFRFLFVDFAIFNVADICVTLGGIATCVYLVFFFDKLEGRADEPPASDES